MKANPANLNYYCFCLQNTFHHFFFLILNDFFSPYFKVIVCDMCFFVCVEFFFLCQGTSGTFLWKLRRLSQHRSTPLCDSRKSHCVTSRWLMWLADIVLRRSADFSNTIRSPWWICPVVWRLLTDWSDWLILKAFRTFIDVAWVLLL